jgi:DNA-binding GntR family transcriptional regulator
VSGSTPGKSRADSDGDRFFTGREELAIDRSSSEPAYSQLARKLRERISMGEFATGDQIPTESELQRQYDLSPMTVRRAIRILVDQNAVRTVRGHGTFVRPASMQTASFDLGSFYALISGPNVKVRIVHARVIKATDRAAQKLDIEPGRRVILIRRVISEGKETLFYHREWLPYDPRKPLVEAELDVTALKDVFRNESGADSKHGKLRLYASVLTESEATYLRAEPGEPAFVLEHLFFDHSDRASTWGLFVCRSDRLLFETDVGFAPEAPRSTEDKETMA